MNPCLRQPPALHTPACGRLCLCLCLVFALGAALAVPAHAAQRTCLSSSVTLSSNGSIEANCSGSGVSVVLNGTSGNRCTYAGSAHSPAVRIDGAGVIEAWCTGSSGVTFTITAAGSATVGTPLPFTIRRSQGSGSPGNDTLTLATGAGSSSEAAFSPATVSFGSNEPDNSTRTPQVIFLRAGQATLTASGSDNPVIPSASIAVGSSGLPACVSFTAPVYTVDAGTVQADMGKHRLTAASGTDPASGAIRFVAPASGAKTLTLTTAGTGYPELVPLEMAVSACPGDFTTVAGACKRFGAIGQSLRIAVGGADCPVQANGVYYLNLRAITPGRNTGFALGAQ